MERERNKRDGGKENRFRGERRDGGEETERRYIGGETDGKRQGEHAREEKEGGRE